MKNKLLLLSAIPSVATLSAQAIERPNIVCVVAEDMSPMLGCFGDNAANTPNLDEFSKSAIRYKMYTSVGVSSPSRYSLITGRYPSADCANNMRTLGELMRPEGLRPYSVVPEAGVKCYTEYLRAAGYYCTNCAKTDYQFEPPVSAWDECGAKAHWSHKKEGQPFFAIFNMEVTHESRMWMRKDEPLTVDPADVVVPPYYPDNEVVRRGIAVSHSNATEMDRNFQAIVDELEAAGEMDNTIIIWYSDNGGPLPRQKREIYESGALVPFMISFPDSYRSGEFSDELVAFVDIPATILSLVGIKPAKNMHGSPFLGKYKGESREYVYGARDRFDETIDKQGCVRDKQYRYVRNYREGTVDYLPVNYRMQIPMMQNLSELHENGELNEAQSRWFDHKRGREEFYDVENDPYEMNNLIDDPRYAKDIARLRKEYSKWDKKYHKYWYFTEEENLARMQPDGVAPAMDAPTATSRRGVVKLACSTPGSSIVYKINDSKKWLLYSSPLQLQKGDKVSFQSDRIGYTESDIVEYIAE